MSQLEKETLEKFSITIFDEELTSFEETAALISNLDLLITVDSAPAHLSGALGIATWIMNSKFNFCYYALKNGESPWYPSSNLFFQEELGDWQTLLLKIKLALRKNDFISNNIV